MKRRGENRNTEWLESWKLERALFRASMLQLLRTGEVVGGRSPSFGSSDELVLYCRDVL